MNDYITGINKGFTTEVSASGSTSAGSTNSSTSTTTTSGTTTGTTSTGGSTTTESAAGRRQLATSGTKLDAVLTTRYNLAKDVLSQK